ncbi:MAG TPA: fibronectin type III domain-containing protein [Thermoanaerobaculia bacterium]|nr:fibronectin type III domain-containing protein [Thermoanaerobaculia bacterium]
MKTHFAKGLWAAALAACLLGGLPADGQQIKRESRDNLAESLETSKADVPTPPSGLRAAAAGSTEASLSWQDNSNDETGFSIELHEGDRSWEYLGTIDSDFTTATIEGLDPGTTYDFRVRAVNDTSLSAPSNKARVTTTASEDGFLRLSDLPDFRFQVRIFPVGSAPIVGKKVSQCAPETLCVSGAVAGRPEVYLRVVGPRPNGYFWPTIVRFTPSRVEVEIEQISTGEVKRYTLEAVPSNTDDLPGLQDRTGFQK